MNIPIMARLAKGDDAHDRPSPYPMIGNKLSEIAYYAFHSVLKCREPDFETM